MNKAYFLISSVNNPTATTKKQQLREVTGVLSNTIAANILHCVHPIVALHTFPIHTVVCRLRLRRAGERVATLRSGPLSSPDFVVQFLEQQVCTLNWDVGFVIQTMHEIGVPLPRLLEVYDHLFKSRVRRILSQIKSFI